MGVQYLQNHPKVVLFKSIVVIKFLNRVFKSVTVFIIHIMYGSITEVRHSGLNITFVVFYKVTTFIEYRIIIIVFIQFRDAIQLQKKGILPLHL